MKPDRTTAPRIVASEPGTLPEAREITLDNGVRAVMCHSPGLEIARISAVTAGGLAEAQMPAVASVAAAMRAEGTRTMTAEAIASAIDYNGAWCNSMATRHHTVTELYTLPGKASAVLPVMAGTVLSPVFPSQETALVASRLAAQAEIAASTPRFHATKVAQELTFGKNHPLAATPDPDSFRAVTQASLQNFHRSFSGASTLKIFVTGNIDSAMENAINSSFGQPLVEPSVQPELNVVPFAPAEGGTHRRVCDSAQSTVCITLPTIPRSHPDYLALRLAVMALGGYFGSRLSQNVREDKGYTYGISASLLGYMEGGVVEIVTDCDPAYVDKVIEETYAEMRRLATMPPDGPEMQRLRQAETAALTEITDSPFSILDFYQTIHCNRLPQTHYRRRCEALAAVTPESIATLAGKYLRPEGAITVVAGA